MSSFWEEQALKYKDDYKAVNFDQIEEELEFANLVKYMDNNKVICDFGCGNGRTLSMLAKKFPESTFVGIDGTKGMIDIANVIKEKENLKNVTFYYYDASLSDVGYKFEKRFDIILTKRLLINLKGDKKKTGLLNIDKMLKNNGKYIMMECFIEPLNKINKIRVCLGLSEITVKHFNEYLTNDFLIFIKEKFNIVIEQDFESLYYFISRVLNAKLSEGQTPDYLAPINIIAKEIEMNFVDILKDYSPEKIYVFNKK